MPLRVLVGDGVITISMSELAAGSHHFEVADLAVSLRALTLPLFRFKEVVAR